MSSATPGAKRPRIVILGAGFGGLEAARALARAEADITLVDRHNHHLFQPLLYQVATAALSPGDIAWPVRTIFRRQRNVQVVMAEVTGIDTAARRVQAGELALPYDALVLATGATHSYFGREDWAPVAPGLKEIKDATDIRRRLLLAFERAEITEDAEERRRLLTFVVVGGGPTGVELAGAMVELARHAMPREFRRIDPAQARVVLIEAGPRILPTFPEELSRVAHRSLERMGVQVLTGTRVTECTATGVECGEERIAASTIVWAAGVVASPAGGWIGAERDRAGRVKVAPDLSVPGHPEIFVVGDLASVTDARGRPVPGNAPAAKQMGRYVGRLLAARAAGGTDLARASGGTDPARASGDMDPARASGDMDPARASGDMDPARASGATETTPFSYRHHGDLATIGRRSAVVSLDSIRLTGLIGWWFWGIAHVWYLIGFRSRVVVSFEWLWSYLTFQRGARLITGREPAGGNATPVPGERQAAAQGTRSAERLPAAAPREAPQPRRVAAGG